MYRLLMYNGHKRKAINVPINIPLDDVIEIAREWGAGRWVLVDDCNIIHEGYI